MSGAQIIWMAGALLAASPTPPRALDPMDQARATVMRALEKGSKATPVRSEIVVRHGEHRARYVLVSARPGHLHMWIEGSEPRSPAGARPPEVSESVTDGKKKYLCLDGQWKSIDLGQDGSALPAGAGLHRKLRPQELLPPITVRRAQLQGRPTKYYEAGLRLESGGPPVVGNVLLWVDDRTGLPLRIEMKGRSGDRDVSYLQTLEYSKSTESEKKMPGKCGPLP